ncbi:hypothetical protein AURDEDRAFT_123444 [Auricularia subglabra TFB-10046 SS5]|nr:hypothetical protein AURDEDRAFT_123444 [Auricularia subglabra TFB-10046 SS5]
MSSLLPIANAASNAAAISSQTGPRLSSGLANEILASIQGVRVNKRAAVVLSGRIRDMADALVSLSEDPEFDPADWGQCAALHSFERILSDVRDALQSISRRNYLVQTVNERKDREKLLDLSERVRNAFGILMVSAGVPSSTQGSNIAVKVQLRARVNTQATMLSATITDMTQRHDQQLEALAESLYEPYARIPAKPVHFGRDAETQAVVRAIDHSLGRVAILGGPGMGKTTLAAAVLHDPSIIARYGSKRFFVPCDAAEGQSVFLSTLASAFGISGSDQKMTQLKLLGQIGSDPALLDVQALLDFLDRDEHGNAHTWEWSTSAL